jgi:hypothetical protein
MSSLEYIREYYGVPADIGRRVTVYGKPGVIVGGHGAYLSVNLDSDSPSIRKTYHPTDQMEYHEMGVVRKMTPAQRRYQEYLDAGECYDSFRHFLQARTARGQR